MSELQDTAKTLNALVALWRRSQVQYLTASAEAHDPDLKLDLATYALQRSRFVTELQGFILGLGQPLSGPASAHDANTRTSWADYRSPAVGRPESEILSRCEAEEERTANECFELVHQSNLPDYIRPVVERHCAEVKQASPHLAALRKAFGLEPVR